MEINTTFSIWDKAYVIYNDNIHEVKVDWIKIDLDKNDKNTRYNITVYIPAWILKVNEIREIYKEDEIFLDIEEAKKELALKKKYENKYSRWESACSSWIQSAAASPYFPRY